MEQQPELSTARAYKSTGLFVDYFLTEKLPQEKIWRDALVDANIKEVLAKLRNLYSSKKSLLPTFNEAQTENEFIRPVLDLLGFSYIVQTPTRAMGRSLMPDYALFANEKAKQKGYTEVKRNNYANVLAVADAKFWERPLDKKLKDDRDTLTNQNPTFQISSYLIATKTKWAILTNGRYWRLYSREYSQTMGEYYQVDLAHILESSNDTDFLYFYLFFRKQAFLPLPTESFLEQVIRESIEYGGKLQENLKSLIFEKIFKYLAQGFADWRQQNGKVETPATLKEIFDSTLILLYRLLFVLYAESRDLLPVKEKDRYYTKSLSKIKAKIKQDIESNKAKSRVSTDYWDDLVNLFRIIDRGDPALNIPKYNGGLFSPTHKFLEQNKIADYYLAEAIYLLTTYYEPTKNAWVFVDYKSLGVKQLGSIYEGLLEFHLNIADKELAVVREKGREKYVPVGEIGRGQRDTGERVSPGELYLENTKAERKATGSYYTPDYIVQYIVKNTVGPLLDEIEKQFEAKRQELKTSSRFRGQSAKWKTATLKEYDPALRALELKVCDPAMGSGHFLVATVDYIANRIYDFLTKYSEQNYFGQEMYESPLYQQIQGIRQNILNEMERQQVTIDKDKLEDDKVIIRRMVMKRCIFGVDLNYLAVELAKLSLWLNSFTVGAPLSFLDHHLRWGNSLIGSDIETVDKAVQGESQLNIFGSMFTGLTSAVQQMVDIALRTDATISELQSSQNDYLNALSLLNPYKRILDIWTSQYFNNAEAKHVITEVRLDPANFDKSYEALHENDKRLVDLAEEISQAKRFFHWELEFPEVWYERLPYGGVKRKENPGFDAVIGNPPYVDSEEMVRSLPDLRDYCSNNLKSASGNWDLYVVFVEQSLSLSRSDGYSSLIVPNKILGAEYALSVQDILRGNTVITINDFSAVRVFQADVYPIVYAVKKTPSLESSTIKLSKMASVLGKSEPVTALTVEAPLRILESLPEGYWSPLFSVNASIVIKALTKSLLLAKTMQVAGAATVSEAYEVAKMLMPLSEHTRTKQCLPLINTGTIDRYENLWFLVGTRYLKKTYVCPVVSIKALANALPNRYQQSVSRKIIIAGMVTQLEAYYDDGQAMAGKSTVLVLGNSETDLLFLTALINSKFATFLYREIFGALALQGGYLRVGPPQISKMPIRNIYLTTSPTERRQKVDTAKNLYLGYLTTGEQDKVLNFVADLLEKKHQPDPELVKKHNADPLNKDFQIPEGALWEQSDVVHDFLAYLAEQMIAMNKQKQEEISAFLKYLKRTIGTDIESLQNKTLLKNYHDHSFEEILGVLERNKRKLKGFNPSSRKDQETLEKEFNQSLEKLEPLKAKIKATDNLIDQIVYKLYGLTDKEIKIVEASVVY